MKKTNEYGSIIAVDPDVDKSGVTTLQFDSRLLRLSSLSFPELLDYLQERSIMDKETGFDTLVVVEAGWLNKAHWHVGKGDGAARSALIGNHTGRNHEVGRKIVEMCYHYGFDVIEQKPLRKMWRGRDGKITHDELARLIEKTGCEFNRKSTNQEERDAALLALFTAKLI